MNHTKKSSNKITNSNKFRHASLFFSEQKTAVLTRKREPILASEHEVLTLKHKYTHTNSLYTCTHTLYKETRTHPGKGRRFLESLRTGPEGRPARRKTYDGDGRRQTPSGTLPNGDIAHPGLLDVPRSYIPGILEKSRLDILQ